MATPLVGGRHPGRAQRAGKGRRHHRLAQMNMILHNNPGAVIRQGNTLANPRFIDGDALKTFRLRRRRSAFQR
jgi:hypothetical protein